MTPDEHLQRAEELLEHHGNNVAGVGEDVARMVMAHIELAKVKTEMGVTSASIGQDEKLAVVQSPPVPSVELPPMITEITYDDRGFANGFRPVHPEGVECVFPPDTKQCSCGRLDPLGDLID